MKAIQNFFNKLTLEQIWLFFVMVAIVIVSVGGAYLLSQGSRQTQEPIATEDEKQEILTEIIKNNPKGVITEENTARNSHLSNVGYQDRTSSASSSSSSSASEDNDEPELEDILENTPEEQAPIPTPYVPEVGDIEDLDPSDVAAPDIDVYNYRYSKVTTYGGPALESCPTQKDQWVNNSNEAVTAGNIVTYYEYFDANRSFYKSIEQEVDGNVTNYYLGRYGTNDNDYIYFLNGDFAVRHLFDLPENFDNGSRFVPTSYSQEVPTSYTPDSYVPESYPSEQENLEIDTGSYFGKNPVVLEIYEKDGENYIVISAGTLIHCSAENPSVPATRIYHVRESDYQIVEQYTYLNGVTSANLLTSRSIEAERDKVAYSQIENIFQFEYENQVREVDYRGYEYNPELRASVIADYLKQGNVPFVGVDDPAFRLVYLSGRMLPEKVENEHFRYVREFYPSTLAGQTEYDNLMEMLAERPVVTYTLAADSAPGWYKKLYANASVHQDMEKSTLISKLESSKVSEIVGQETFYPAVLYTGSNSQVLTEAVLFTLAWQNNPAVSYVEPISYFGNENPVYPSYPLPASYPDSYPEGATSYPYPYIDSVTGESLEQRILLDLKKSEFSGVMNVLQGTTFGKIDLLAHFSWEADNLNNETRYEAAREELEEAFTVNQDYGYYDVD